MNCVQQSQFDADHMRHEINNVSKQLQLLKPSTSSEWIQLIQWLNDQNFSFFGCHVIDQSEKKPVIKIALGICRKKVKIPDLSSLSDDLIAHTNQSPFIVDRTTINSPIQRFEPLMKVSFKFNTTQYIFYGILKRSSMYAKNIDTPLINKKMDYIFNQRRFLIGSYDYNEVIRIFNDIPKNSNYFGHQRKHCLKWWTLLCPLPIQITFKALKIPPIIHAITTIFCHPLLFIWCGYGPINLIIHL